MKKKENLILLFIIEKKARKISIFALLGTCLLMSIIVFQISNNELIINNSVDNIENLNPISSIWYLSGIYINDDDSDWDWDEFTNDNPQPWCNFSGGVYYIKNVVINSGGYINIQHSDVNFVIENCTVINSDSNGIRLRDVENGIIRGNNFSNNTLDGISLIYMEWYDLYLLGWREESSNNIEIWNNTVSYNSDDGINIEGRDNSLTCDNNNITGNTLIGNINDGISIIYGDVNTVINNTCLSNGGSGIYIDDNDGDTINENNCSFNNAYGIQVYDSDGNTINDNDCNDNYHGIYLSRSDDNVIIGNIANNNDEVGLYLKSCAGIQSEWSNDLSGNTVNNNKIGIHLYASDYTYFGTGNIINGNTQYGIFLSEASTNNNISGNIVSNNGEYDICYTSDCEDNTFLNNGVTAFNLGNPGSGGGFDPLPILFIIAFIAIVAGIAYLGYRKNQALKRAGVRENITEEQPRVIFVRPGLVIQEQAPRSQSQVVYSGDSHDHKNKPITPKEIDLYEFYCAKCDHKSLGYQVFCPMCGERMRQPKLAAMHNPNEKVQCVICHTGTCSTCNHDITGEDACFEECPYCERSYHKHCWNKTMESFGKCGFCLETPPPELLPNAFKTQSYNQYKDS